MKNLVSFIFLLALLVSGCSQEEMLKGVTSASSGRIFTTSFEQKDSRTFVKDGYLSRWTANDRISLFDSNTQNLEYKFDGETGDSEGTFSMVNISGGTGSSLTSNYAVYPYSKDVQIAADGKIDNDEIDDFIYIQEELERISVTVETLQIWSEKMLANGVIDAEAYKAKKSK